MEESTHLQLLTDGEFNTILAAADDAAHRRLINARLKDRNQILKNWIFGLLYTAGIGDEAIRTKVQEQMAAGKPGKAQRIACKLELLMADKGKVKVNAIQEKETAPANKTTTNPDPAVNSLEDQDLPSAKYLMSYEPVDQDDADCINTLSVRRGLPRRNFRFQNGNRPAGNGRPANVDNKNIVCRYKPCGKTGHMQKDCYKRKKDKAPFVDQNGIPWRTQPANNSMAQTSSHNQEKLALNYFRVL